MKGIERTQATLKTVVLTFTIAAAIVGVAVGGVNWYKNSKKTFEGYNKLKARVDKIEIVMHAEQASQRVLIEALIKKMMPNEAETIIRQSDEMRKALEESMAGHNPDPPVEEVKR